MKKISIFLLMLFSIFCFSQSTEPCLPDCPGDVWEPPPGQDGIIHTIELSGCGFFDVVYRTRLACAKYRDVYIELIGSNGGAYDIQNCVENFFGNDYGAFVNAITEQLLIDNPMEFPPIESGCEDNWRVAKGSCWERVFILSVDDIDGIIPKEAQSKQFDYYYGHPEF